MPGTLALQEAAPANLSAASIDSLAEKLAEIYDFKPGADLYKLIKSIGGKIVFQNPDDWLATQNGSIVIEGPEKFTLYVAQFTGLWKDRLTMAHDLGHYILHSRYGKIAPLMFPRRGEGVIEQEAHWFAMCFLMPKGKFLEIFQPDKDRLKAAGVFEVSSELIETRAKSLGFE